MTRRGHEGTYENSLGFIHFNSAVILTTIYFSIPNPHENE